MRHLSLKRLSLMKRLPLIRILMLAVGFMLLLSVNSLLTQLLGGASGASASTARGSFGVSGSSSFDPSTLGGSITSTVESMVGIGLVGVALVLEVLSFCLPKPKTQRGGDS